MNANHLAIALPTVGVELEALQVDCQGAGRFRIMRNRGAVGGNSRVSVQVGKIGWRPFTWRRLFAEGEGHRGASQADETAGQRFDTEPDLQVGHFGVDAGGCWAS